MHTYQVVRVFIIIAIYLQQYNGQWLQSPLPPTYTYYCSAMMCRVEAGATPLSCEGLRVTSSTLIDGGFFFGTRHCLADICMSSTITRCATCKSYNTACLFVMYILRSS